jgi:hypothetical protein
MADFTVTLNDRLTEELDLMVAERNRPAVPGAPVGTLTASQLCTQLVRQTVRQHRLERAASQASTLPELIERASPAVRTSIYTQLGYVPIVVD